MSKSELFFVLKVSGFDEFKVKLQLLPSNHHLSFYNNAVCVLVLSRIENFISFKYFN